MNTIKKLKLDSPEAIRRAAQILIDKFHSKSDVGEAFGYNRESLAQVDAFIDRQATQATPGEKERLVQLIGAYLGEFMVHEYGGTWGLDNGRWFLRVGNDFKLTSPFEAVELGFEYSAKGTPSDLFAAAEAIRGVGCDIGLYCDIHGCEGGSFLDRNDEPICRACHPPISLAEIEIVGAKPRCRTLQ